MKGYTKADAKAERAEMVARLHRGERVERSSRTLGETKLRDVTVDHVAGWSQGNEQALAPSTAWLALIAMNQICQQLSRQRTPKHLKRDAARREVVRAPAVMRLLRERWLVSPYKAAEAARLLQGERGGRRLPPPPSSSPRG